MSIWRQFYSITKDAHFTSRPMRGEPEKKPASNLVAQMRAKLQAGERQGSGETARQRTGGMFGS